MLSTKSRANKVTKPKLDKGEKHDNHDKRRKGHNPHKPSFRKAYRGGGIEENLDPEGDNRKHDEKLLKELSQSLVECSRQRLRAVHMSFRQYGNDQSKMSSKEMTQSLQDNSITIPNRTLKPLSKKFESTTGIDLEGMYKFLTEAHARTGRDSVLAMYKRNDLDRRHGVPQDEVDEDFLWRIESQLIKSHDYVDIEALRTELQRLDSGASGRLDSNLLKQTCTDMQIPVFGALLKNLLKRCDEHKNGKVSWPEFLFFLQRAQENAWKSCPSLKELPEKQRNKTPVAPSPLDELSTRARTTIVNKLRKKTSVKKTEAPDLSGGQGKKEETKPKPIDGQPAKAAKDAINTKKEQQSESAPKQPVVDKGDSSKKIEEPNDSKKVEDVSKSKKTEPEAVLNPTDNRDTQIKSDDNKDRDTGPGTYAKETKNTENKHLLRRENPIDIRVHEPPEVQTPTKKPSPTPATPIPPLEADNKEDKARETKKDVKKENVTAEPPPAESVPDKQVNNVDDKVGVSDEQIVNTQADAQVPAASHEQNQSTEGKEATDEETTIAINIRGKILEFKANKEYLRSQTIDPPRERLKLKWVYGYRGNDCRKNIHVLASKEIVYFIAHLAVVYNQELHQQRHYKEHTEEIKCIDVHSNKVLVATGQYASRKNPNIKAHIRIWRSDNLHTLHVLGTDLFEKSVACLAFSPGKDLLAAVDNCLEKKLSVWDSTTGELRGHEMLHTDLVCDVGFSCHSPDVVVTVGKEHLCWWKVYPDSDKIQPAANPDYETFLKAKFVICFTHTEQGDLITGDSNGNLYVFGEGGNTITNFVKHAHDGPVFTVLFYRGHILSGGRDGILHCWQYNKNMDSTGFLQIPKSEGGVRMLAVQENRLYIGTTMNSMLVANLTDGESPIAEATLDPVPLTQCHYDDLRGIASVPGTGMDIVSAGLDGVVCGFNTTTRQCVNKFQRKGNLYISIDAADGGSLIALGTKDGHLQLLQYKDDQYAEVFNRKLCKDRLDIVRFSPGFQWLAAGCHDKSVYIMTYRPRDDINASGWDLVGRLEGHTGYITGLDWSSKKTPDGYIMRTSSSELELKYWLPETLKPFDTQLPPDTDWSSHTVLVDVSIAGILATKCSLETEAVTMSSNPTRSLLVMGDNSGGLSLFRYPSSLKGVFCHGYKSHAVVYSARFTPNGTNVISVGGRDSCLMQWEVV